MNHHNLKAVAGSGNRNWGQNFAKASEEIANQYHVPLLMKFELHGNQAIADEFKEKVVNLYENDKQAKKNHIELNNKVTKRREDGFSILKKIKKH